MHLHSSSTRRRHRAGSEHQSSALAVWSSHQSWSHGERCRFPDWLRQHAFCSAVLGQHHVQQEHRLKEVFPGHQEGGWLQTGVCQGLHEEAQPHSGTGCKFSILIRWSMNDVSFMSQAHEHERLVTWYNPLGLTDMAIPGEDNIIKWRSQTITEKQWHEQTRTAWDIAPSLAVSLPARFNNSDALVREVTRLVRLNPMAVSHIPDAVHYLVTAHSMEADAPEVGMSTLLCNHLTLNFPWFQLAHMLTWAPVSPIHALGYFSRQYPPHPISHQYAIKCLRSYPPVSLPSPLFLMMI